MAQGTENVTATANDSGVERVSLGLWVGVVAATLQLSSIASDFYTVNGEIRDAWFGVPHTADLIVISALATIVLLGLTAADRSPLGGRAVGLLLGGLGTVAALQVAYRMVVPPFGCLTYTCGLTAGGPETGLLLGIWIALVGCVLAAVGGFLHAFSRRARATEPNFWVAARQTGATPWLGTAAVAAVGMFVVGFTILDFYTVPQGDGVSDWSAWLSIPHTSTVILLIALAIAVLVYAASRRRSSLTPQALGATIAVLAFLATARTAYRIVVSPFFSGPAEGVFGEGVVINAPAYVAVLLGVVTLVAGLLHARSGAVSRGRVDSSAGATAG